jgi:chemotaxis protein histidine kinase CheA/PAS domain-containing protein
MAVKGKVNLNDWNPEKVQGVSVEGDWSFFWSKLIRPRDIQAGKIPEAEWRPSHGVWKGKRGTTGYGTYLLKVEGLRPGSYALEKTYIYNSFNIFVVEPKKIQKVIQFGNVSKKIQDDVPYMGYLSGHFTVGAEPFYIVVQISNYSFRNGGILGHFTITSKKVFDKKNLFSVVIDTFIIGCLLITGIYHIFIFFLRRKDKLSLWFAISIFLLALRAYFGPGYIYSAYPDTSLLGLSIKSRLYYLTFYPIPFCLAYFLHYLLDELLNKKLLLGFTIHAFTLIFLSLFFSVEYYAHSIVLYSFYFMLAIGMGHLAYIFGFLFYKKKYHHILNFIPTLILCGGGFHDILINFLADNPVNIAPYTVILFVLLQSYNIAKKNAIAHNTAEKLSEDLEKEVKIQTREAVEAKDKAEASEQKVSELINNMRQAVFITNNKSIIIEPVSTFSSEIFNENIEGKTVYETLFRNLDRNSEEYAKIMTATGVIFGADDLQWLMMYEFLPLRIIYKKSNKDSEKILKVIYTPLYNRDGILERLMYVIEDITEVEKLEKQMVIEREEGSKKSHIIQELVSNKKEDITQFFHDAIKIFKNVMNIWKNLRVLILDKKEPKGLEGFLRDLHTIKGNSRIYGFSHISKSTHKVESTFSILSKNPFNEWTADDLSQFTQELYGLQGQINEYLWLAEEILGVEREEETKLKEELHTGLKELEYWLGHFHHSSFDTNKDDSDYGIFKKIDSLDEDYREQIYVSLKRSFHGMKGLARSIGNKDLSSLIHIGESIIFKLEEGTSSPEEIKKDLFPSLRKIRKESSIIFLNSSQFNSLDLNYDLWTEIFCEYFNVLAYWKDKENFKFNELTRRVYLLYAKATGGQFLYIPIIIRTLYDYMELDWEKQKDEIHFCLEMIWKFIVLIFKLDLNKNMDLNSRQIMLEKLMQRKKEKESKGLIDEINKNCEMKDTPLFLNSLTRVLKEGYSIQDVYDVVSYFNFGHENNFFHLISEQDIFFKFNDIYLLLKESFKEGRDHLHLEELNIKIGEGEEENDEMVKFFNDLLQHKNPAWFQYLMKIELLRVLKNYVSIEDDREQEIRPDFLDILSQNYLRAKDAIENLMETEQLKEKVNDYFNFLLEVPVKYSFRNLKTMVKEVGKSLGKKIMLKMDGDQGSLHKDSLGLLKDAIIHIVRNSIDHGIESPEERKQLGKPEIGEINIQCEERDQGQLFIQIKDDGRGIDEEKLCLKALEKGLLTEKEINVMSLEEKTKIIFRPGFSTKEEVTEISGRGIGMDVVKMNLHRIGGSIEIKNIKGKGTQFDICLKKI